MLSSAMYSIRPLFFVLFTGGGLYAGVYFHSIAIRIAANVLDFLCIVWHPSTQYQLLSAVVELASRLRDVSNIDATKSVSSMRLVLCHRNHSTSRQAMTVLKLIGGGVLCRFWRNFGVLRDMWHVCHLASQNTFITFMPK